MRSKHVAAPTGRIQTCPVLTLEDDLQEPCEHASQQVHAPKARLRTLLATGAAVLLSLGMVACNDEKDPDTPPSECEGDACEEPCVGDDCEPVVTLKECLGIVTAGSDDASLAVLDLESLTIRTDITTLHKDVALVAADDLLYAVNRFGADNIQALNASKKFETLWQRSLGAGSNPQAMAVHGNHGFVPLIAEGKVAIVDLTATTDASFVLSESLAIAPSGPWDGDKSEPINVLVHGDVVYVLSQGLNGWSCEPGAHSRLLAFDSTSFAPKTVFNGESHIDLSTCNAAELAVLGDTLYVQSIGGYRDGSDTDIDDGAIEAFNLLTGTSEGVVLNETQAGNFDIFQIYASNSGTGLWVTLSDPLDFSGMHLRYLDLSGDAPVLGETLHVGQMWAIVEHEKQLFITDRRANGEGVYVFDTTTNTLVSEEPLDTGLPPRSATKFTRAGSCF